MNSDRIEVKEHEGQRVVRLKYPTSPGGQVLRPDILGDPDKLARYINDWQVAWAHETALRTPDGALSPQPPFDPAKLRRLMDEDSFLEFEYERKKGEGTPDQVLEILYNTYVREEPAMMAAYNAA